MQSLLCTFAVLVLAAKVIAEPSPIPVEEEPHHQVVLKNDFVLVLRVTLPLGESTLFHTHSYDRVAVQLTDTAITQQKLGEAGRAPERKKPGDISASEINGSYTHRVHNVGPSVFEVLDVELLRRPKHTEGKAAATGEAENPSARGLQMDAGAKNCICNAYA